MKYEVNFYCAHCGQLVKKQHQHAAAHKLRKHALIAKNGTVLCL